MRTAMVPMIDGSSLKADRLALSDMDVKPALLNPETAWKTECQAASAGG